MKPPCLSTFLYSPLLTILTQDHMDGLSYNNPLTHPCNQSCLPWGPKAQRNSASTQVVDPRGLGVLLAIVSASQTRLTLPDLSATSGASPQGPSTARGWFHLKLHGVTPLPSIERILSPELLTLSQHGGAVFTKSTRCSLTTDP